MRSPICAFLGHVDAGKTSIMDAIRDTMNAYKESGGLTQNIGSTEVPTDRIKEIASDLLSKFNINIKVPSILLFDFGYLLLCLLSVLLYLQLMRLSFLK